MNNTVHYRHVRHTLALMCAKNHLLTFSSFLNIWENVEWPRFFWTTLYTNRRDTHTNMTFTLTIVTYRLTNVSPAVRRPMLTNTTDSCDMLPMTSPSTFDVPWLKCLTTSDHTHRQWPLYTCTCCLYSNAVKSCVQVGVIANTLQVYVYSTER